MHANMTGIERSLRREKDEIVALIGSTDAVKADSPKPVLLSCESKAKERTMGRPLPCCAATFLYRGQELEEACVLSVRVHI
jgi:hypothetical protein